MSAIGHVTTLTGISGLRVGTVFPLDEGVLDGSPAGAWPPEELMAGRTEPRVLKLVVLDEASVGQVLSLGGKVRASRWAGVFMGAHVAGRADHALVAKRRFIERVGLARSRDGLLLFQGRVTGLAAPKGAGP